MATLLAAPPPAVRRRVVAGLIVITGLSWAYLLFLGSQMGAMGSPFAMPMTSTWTGQQVALMWTMWAVMMAGMMLPSAAPMISAYSTTISSDSGGPEGSTGLFVAGYLVAWSAFASVATGAQWVLHDAALVSPMGVSTSTRLGGFLLLAAGVYQFSGVKEACLRQCRTPLGFLLNEWRPGRRGAVVMGLRHGTFCVGCCWALMALLFVLGVMNLWWIALVAAFVLLEKVVPIEAVTRVLGGSLVVWGSVLLVL
jgi:predicted metal-binding membrane protein